MGTLECCTRAEGMRSVEPGGKQIMRRRSQRIRWPEDQVAAKVGVKVDEGGDHPQARLAKSRWEAVIARGPKLKVQAAKTLLMQFQCIEGFHALSSVLLSW
jgi:hypothetical protein